MNTAERIHLLVRRSGVSDRKIRSTLAKLCGISVQAVRDWFDGKTKNIGHEHLIAISEEYGVTLDWLLTGEPPIDGLTAKETERVRVEGYSAYRDLQGPNPGNNSRDGYGVEELPTSFMTEEQKLDAIRQTLDEISDEDFLEIVPQFAARLARLSQKRSS